MEDKSSTHLITVFLLILITINLFILDLKVFSPGTIKISDIAIVATPIPSPVTISGNTASYNLSCPQSCISLVQEATKSMALNIGAPAENTVVPTLPKTSTSHEYFVPLGSGNTQKSSWDDITATETIIDPANYGAIKEVYLIASLRNPTKNGKVEAQLYNATDKNPVWDSHIVMDGPLSQTITSNRIAFPSGPKLYRVQLKSTLSALVYLDNAKIRIVTE